MKTVYCIFDSWTNELLDCYSTEALAEKGIDELRDKTRELNGGFLSIAEHHDRWEIKSRGIN